MDGSGDKAGFRNASLKGTAVTADTREGGESGRRAGRRGSSRGGRGMAQMRQSQGDLRGRIARMWWLHAKGLGGEAGKEDAQSGQQAFRKPDEASVQRPVERSQYRPQTCSVLDSTG